MAVPKPTIFSGLFGQLDQIIAHARAKSELTEVLALGDADLANSLAGTNIDLAVEGASKLRGHPIFSFF